MLSSLLQKLMFVNQFSIMDGKIDFLGERHIMLDADSLIALQNIDTTKAYNLGKDASKSKIKNITEHAQVYKNMKSSELKNIADLSKKVGKTDEGTIKIIEEVFEVYGLGKLEIVDLNNKDKKALIRIKNSTLAFEPLKKGKGKKPVCTLTAGILAGIFSYIFGKDVDCIEKKCMVMSSEHCEFEVA